MNEIAKRSIQNREKLQKNLIDKNNTEKNNYILSLKKYLEKEKKENQLKEEKLFKKYQSFVSTIFLIIIYCMI